MSQALLGLLFVPHVPFLPVPNSEDMPIGRVESATHQWNNLAQISHNFQMPLLILIPEGNDDLGSSLGYENREHEALRMRAYKHPARNDAGIRARDTYRA